MYPNADRTPLPADLCYDPEGKPCCVVCKCYLGPWISSAFAHVKGKRHLRKRATLPDGAVESRKMLVMEGKHDEDSAVKQLLPAETRNVYSWSISRVKDEINEAEIGDIEPLVNQFEKVMVFPHEEGPTPDTVTIDKQKFVEAVISGEWKANMSDDEGFDDEAEEFGDDKGGILFAKNRAAGFAPLNFRPKVPTKSFFDSMPPESPPPLCAQRLAKTLIGFKRKQQALGKPQDRFGSPDSIFIEYRREKMKTTDHVVKIPSLIDDDEYPPWLLSPEAEDTIEFSEDLMHTLHHEILYFARFVSPTSVETRYRENAVKTTRIIVQELWPKSQLKLFGSYATGIYLPSGDIDVTVMGASMGGHGENVDRLAHAIRSINGFARKIHVIKARVPLVRLVTREGNIQVDISFNQSSGVDYLRRIRGYLQEYPHVRPLLLVLKCFMQQQDLNSAFSGGLCSYGLLLLLVSHLQRYRDNFPKSETNLGSILCNFFEFYGKLLNYCMVGVALRDGGSYYNKIQRYDTDPVDMLRFSVEDPNNPSNEVGRNGFKGALVREAFSKAADALSKWRRDCVLQPTTPLSTIIKRDEVLLLRWKAVSEELWRNRSKAQCGYLRDAD